MPNGAGKGKGKASSNNDFVEVVSKKQQHLAARKQEREQIEQARQAAEGQLRPRWGSDLAWTERKTLDDVLKLLNNNEVHKVIKKFENTPIEYQPQRGALPQKCLDTGFMVLFKGGGEDWGDGVEVIPIHPPLAHVHFHLEPGSKKILRAHVKYGSHEHSAKTPPRSSPDDEDPNKIIYKKLKARAEAPRPSTSGSQ